MTTGLRKNTVYINAREAGQPTVAQIVSTANPAVVQGGVFMLSAGTHDTADVSFTGNWDTVTFTGPNTPTGSQTTEVQGAGGANANWTIGGNAQRVRLVNLNLRGSITIDSTRGAHWFENVFAFGGVNILNSGSSGSTFLVFTDCSFGGAVSIANITGTVTFVRCNFQGNTIANNQSSPGKVIFRDCARIPTLAGQYTLLGVNTFAVGTSRLDATQVYANGQLITPGGAPTITKVFGTPGDVNASTTAFFSAVCPSGTAISGGYTSTSEEVAMVDSDQVSSTVWGVRVRNLRTGFGVASVTPFVICLS
jgi:hypothetical protein